MRLSTICGLSLAWPAAVAFYLLVADRLIWPLSLDFQTLVFGLYELEDLPLDVGTTGRFLARYASAPLLVTALAAIVSRTCGRKQPWPLDRLPDRVVALVQGTLFALWAVACVPLSVGLSVRTAIVASLWIEWSQNVEPAMEWLLFRVPIVTLPGLLVAGIWAAGLVGRKPDPARHRSGPRRLLLGGLGGLAMIATLTVFAVVSLRTCRVATVAGRGSYEQVCGDCHSLTQPLHFVKTPAGWRRTVDRMQTRHEAPLDEGEAEEVVEFLTAMRGLSAGAAFQTRCQRCHYGSTSEWSDRSTEEWEAIVGRVARWSPFYYDAPVRSLLVEYLSEHHGATGDAQDHATAADDRYRMVGRQCSACHAVSLEAGRYRAETEEETSDLVRRMGLKIPGGIPDDEAPRLTTAYRELLSEPELLEDLCPHDSPVENPGLLRW